jgi:hypothetical protein
MSDKKKGRPRIYDTQEELQEAIDTYFSECKPRFDDDGNLISLGFPTLTGLAYYLGFESRQSIYDYEKSGTFSYTIKRARLYIESRHEENLSNPMMKATGSIFWLKNYGWSDRQDVSIGGMESAPSLKIEVVGED